MYNPVYSAPYNYMHGQPSPENSVAYCHVNKHKGRLSVKIMKKHECLKKQCPWLEKLEHPYWDQRKARKAKKTQKV